jgi:hypothetical protein
MRAFVSLIVLVASAVSAEAQLFCNPWRQAYHQEQLNTIRYQMLADQQRQQMEILRLQLQGAQPAASGVPPTVTQEVVIYLVQPAQPVVPQVIPQWVPQTIPLPQILEKPSPPVVIQGPPQTVPIVLPGGAPQQQLPGGAPQQPLPGGAPQQQLPGGAPIQILPGGAPIQVLPGSGTVPKTSPEVSPPPAAPKQVLPGGAPNPSGYQRYTKWRPVTSRPLHR